MSAIPAVVPRWVDTPGDGVRGVHVHDEQAPDDLIAALAAYAEREVVPRDAVLLAAHVRVLAALSGDDDVVAGVRGCRGAPTRAVGLDVGAGSWRTLVRRAALALEEPAGATTDAPAETVLELRTAPDELDGDVVLGVALGRSARGDVVRVAARDDVLDRAATARVAGYHLAALRALATDPDAVPTATSVVGPEEVVWQLTALTGPVRPRPDVRAHDLVLQQARERPDAVAVVCGDQQRSYAWLADRALRVAGGLRDRGLRDEEVVAVVAERGLEWAVAVLGVLLAGGAYLPVEPGFPPDRIAAMLRRSGTRFALADAPGGDHLETAVAAVAGTTRVRLADLSHEPPGSPVPVGRDQLAYVYFTSGSTGEPKGAMCEHAGLLNHLLAKIEDLELGPHGVVAQTAPACFDISLWQLLAPLLVGGTAVIVDHDTVLDVPRFVDTLLARRVTVLQVVPSYLDAVLAHLEAHPRALPDLRFVAVTGEAVKKELTVRWFAAHPRIPLVNAYGLTETSDDTNHAVLHAPPTRDRVPLGPPVANARVHVVDASLVPVPLGAPGEIVFAGVCVGRGYVGDPERTRAAYGPDPYHPGERLYRSGDRGRWLPDGSLEFLGRRDSQVKIAGFRIELGEVSGALLRVPGVRDGAVVVVDGAAGRALAGFYTGDDAPEAGTVRDALAGALPAYMVPAMLHHRDRLPLTGNGKIDEKALTTLAAGLAGPADAPSDGPSDGATTPTERRVVAAAARVLGVDESLLDARDGFFDRGATSLQAVKLAIALDRVVDIADLTRHPVLADLAALIDRRATSA